MSLRKSSCAFALATAAVLLCVVANPVTAQSLPTRRAGLWKSETVSVDGKAAAKDNAMRAQMCVDAASDRRLLEHSLVKGGSGGCSAPNIKKEDAAHVVEMTCKATQGGTTYRTIYTGDFNSRIQAVTTTKQTPPDPEAPNLNLRQVATLVSPQCPDGWKPGDVQVEGMPKMNLMGLMDLTDGLMKGLDKIFGR